MGIRTQILAGRRIVGSHKTLVTYVPDLDDDSVCIKEVASHLQAYYAMCRHNRWGVTHHFLKAAVQDLHDVLNEKGRPLRHSIS